jgi:hypothetical protein
MKTYAVIKPITAVQYFDGNSYEEHEHGLTRSLGRVNGQAYSLYITCGGSLRDTADQAASEINGIVVPVESEYWPDSQSILEAYADKGSEITY